MFFFLNFLGGLNSIVHKTNLPVKGPFIAYNISFSHTIYAYNIICTHKLYAVEGNLTKFGAFSLPRLAEVSLLYAVSTNLIDRLLSGITWLKYLSLVHFRKI